MTIGIIIGLVVIALIIILGSIIINGPSQKFDIRDYFEAENKINSFKERVFEVCKVFSHDYHDPKRKEIWDACIGSDYSNVAGFMRFEIMPHIYGELDSILVSFDLGYETYDGEAFMSVQFPFSLLNVSDDELRSRYNAVNGGKNKTDKHFKIVEKEVENAN